MRVCPEPGCPTLIQNGERRCITHRRAHERARGSRQARGYDSTHDKLRAQWVPRVATGTVRCWRCGQYIGAQEPFDLGHDDTDRTKYRGPEHVRCNRSTRDRRPTP